MIHALLNNSEPLNYLLFYLPLVLFTLGYLVICNKVSQGRIPVNRFWLISLAYLFLMRLQDFQVQFSMNPDEEQWLICANSLVDSPSRYFSTFFIGEFTRFFGILPLSIFRIFTDYVSYEHARFLNISLFFIFILIQFKLLSLWFKTHISIPVLSLFIVLFASASHYDLINYNSESSAVVLYSLAIYLFARNYLQSKPAFSYFLLGFICAITPFAKEQGVFITAILVSLIALKLIFDKNWKAFIFFGAGGISFVFLYVGLIIALFGFDSLVQALETGLEYTSNSESGGIVWKDLIIKSLQIEYFNNVWFIPVSLFLIALAIAWKNRTTEQNRSKSQALIFFSVLSLTIFYTINISKNPLFHYMLYFLISMPWIMALGFESRLSKKENQLIPLFLCALVFILQSNENLLALRLSRVNEAQCRECFDAYHAADPVNQVIQKHRKDGDAIIIWGYENKYMVYNRLHRGSASLYPVFAMNGYSQRDLVIDQYIENVEEIKPALFAELVGPGRHWFNDRDKYGLAENAPDLKAIIDRDYSIIAESENYRIYSRN